MLQAQVPNLNQYFVQEVLKNFLPQILQNQFSQMAQVHQPNPNEVLTTKPMLQSQVPNVPVQQAPIQVQGQSIRDYFMPHARYIHNAIRLPPIDASDFVIKQYVWDLIKEHALFYGAETEDPYQFLTRFLDVCNTIKISGASDDAIRLRIFPFALRDSAVDWLYSQAHDSLHTWQDVTSSFLSYYFPLHKTMKIRAEIATFSQQPGELLCEAWDRMKALLRKCPHHGYNMGSQMVIFYYGLRDDAKNVLDLASGGSLMNLTPPVVYATIERITDNNRQWDIGKPAQKKVVETLETDQLKMMMPRMESMEKAIMGLEMGQRLQQHSSSHHLNQDHQPFSQVPLAPPGLSHLPQRQEGKPRWEEAIESMAMLDEAFVKNLEQYKTVTNTRLANMEALLISLGTQMGQLADNLNTSPHGGLPTKTVRNPNEVNAIYAVYHDGEDDDMVTEIRKAVRVMASVEKTNDELFVDETVEQDKKLKGNLVGKHANNTTFLPV